MSPVIFSQSNTVLRGGPAEKYGTPEDVANLPIWRSEGHCISCWRLTMLERFVLLITGCVWLHVASTNHPPVVLCAENPFPKDTQ